MLLLLLLLLLLMALLLLLVVVVVVVVVCCSRVDCRASVVVMQESKMWCLNMPNSINFAFDYYIFCLLGAAAYLPGTVPPFPQTPLLSLRLILTSSSSSSTSSYDVKPERTPPPPFFPPMLLFPTGFPQLYFYMLKGGERSPPLPFLLPSPPSSPTLPPLWQPPAPASDAR